MSNVATTIDRNVAEVINGYFAVWNQTDPARRRELIAQTWSDAATFVDPVMSADGAAAIDGLVTGVQEQFPGHEFRQLGQADTHGNYVRFSWEMVASGGSESLIEGTDFAVLAPDGRLLTVIGFLDKVPTA